MKKFFSILAAAVALSLSSCNRAQDSEQTAKDIRFNITVDEIGLTADTKAVKSGWEAGDKLNLWFGEQRYQSEGPQVVLVYDGSEWMIQDFPDMYRIEQELGKGHDTFSVFYESGNDLNRYFVDSYQIKPGNDMLVNGVTYRYALCAVCRHLPFELKDGLLSAKISGWKFATAVQITVTDVPDEYITGETSMIDYTPGVGWLVALQWIENYDGGMKLAATAGTAGAITGRHPGSLEFHFMNTYAVPVNGEITIGLTTDGGETYKVFSKVFPEGLPAITEDGFKAITIPFSKFK